MNKSKETGYIELIGQRINKIYGDLVDERIIDRANKEIEDFYKVGQLDNIFKIGKIFQKKIDKGNLIIPRLSTGNSFLLYLLNVSNVNPLPRHSYCPRCHSFYWGNKQSECCDNCGARLIEDGFDLDYRLLIDDIKRMNTQFHFSTSNKHSEYNKLYKLTYSRELGYLKNLGFTQKDLKGTLEDISEIIKCFDESYFAKKYKKRVIGHYQAFVCLGDLGNLRIQKQVLKEKVNNFDDLVRVVTMMHGTGVRDNSEKYGVNIYSRDDLFKFLLSSQLSVDDSLLICRETRLSGNGHLSKLSEEKLKEAGVASNYIEFMRSIRYIFMRGHVIATLKVLTLLAEIYLKEPERFYKAYFMDNPVKPRLTNGELIVKLVESKCTKLEEAYIVSTEREERL